MPDLKHIELQQTGLKVTLPRLAIMEIFQQSLQRHLSAEDIYRVLLSKNAEIGLATVYRVLTQFEQAGILSRHHFDGAETSGKAVYELADEHHHDHLVCLDCGQVEEFFDADIEQRQHAVAKKRGFELVEHALSLYAHCRKTNCPSKRSGAEQTHQTY